MVKLVYTRDLKSLAYPKGGVRVRPPLRAPSVFLSQDFIVIVFNLACEQSHAFEGWFGSAADMVTQQTRGLLACPVCGSAQIEKQLSAPRLNLLPAGTAVPHSDGAIETAAPAAPRTAVALAPEHAQLRELIRHVLENTEDVGQSFPEEARRIHYQEVPARSIRGVASRQEAEALAEEGIAVAQLPFPMIEKSDLN